MRGQSVVSLQEVVAANPTNWEARLVLADKGRREQLPGLALREYLILFERGKLPRARYPVVAEMLLARAKERLAYGDSDAARDMELGYRLGATQIEHLSREAYALAAVSALRHSSRFRQVQAKDWLAKLRRVAPADVRGRYQQVLRTEELAPVVLWLVRHGAKKSALQFAQRYVDSGGQNPEILRHWLLLHRWWFGSRRQPIPSRIAQSIPSPMPTLGPLDELIRSVLWSHPNASPEARESALSRQRASELESMHRIDSSKADRLADRFADRDVYQARRMAALVDFYFQMGDFTRATMWAERLVEYAPHKPAHHLVAALALAASGQGDRAAQEATIGAAASGDPGWYWAVLARRLRLSGDALGALAAGRIALGLTAPGQDVGVLLEIYLGQQELRRAEDAETTRQKLLSRFARREEGAVLGLLKVADAMIREGQSRETSPSESLLWPLGL